MAGAIPISQIVSVTPGVIGANGGLNFLNGLILTTNHTVVPSGTLVSYTSATDVGTAFGATSNEYLMAQVYFSGYVNSLETPSTLYFGGITPDTTGPSTIGAQMSVLAAANQQWTGVTMAEEFSLADKQGLATWIGAQNNRFWGVIWDTDPQAIVGGTSKAFGAWLLTQTLSGVTAIYQDPLAAALCIAWMASLNYDVDNGRQALAFTRNGLVSASVSNGTTAQTLLANGYSYYGAYAGATGNFVFLNNGAVSGQFLWADSYINQIWMNAEFQNDIINLFLNAGNIPFNTEGDTLIAAALQDTITAALAFGAIRTGVTLSQAQIQEVNNAAGRMISDTLQTRGWYMLPGASTSSGANRVARTVPGCKIFYTDGQSVQSISIASTEVQ